MASLSPTGAHSDFTNYNEYKDISVPGERIATTGITGPELGPAVYSYMSGTSFSAPITSAVAALMYSVYPDLDPYEAMAIIKQTAAPLPDTWTNYHASMGSAGALDARAAIARTIQLSQGSSVVPEPVDPTPVDPDPVVPGPVDPIPVDPEPVDPEPVEPSPEIPDPDLPEEVTAVFRLYNRYTTEHLLTTDPAEYLMLGLLGWNQEDVAFFLPERSAIPIYRLYNDWNGDHFYTTNLTEYDKLGRDGWQQEGVKLYGAAKSAFTTPVYRVFNPYMTRNGGAFSHLWTNSYIEYRGLLGLGWRGEGVSWYAL